MGVGALELAVVAALLSRLELRLKHLLLLWLSTSFLAYRIAAHWRHPEKPCPCLGNLSEHLPLSPETISALLLGLVLFLVIGSSSSLLWLRGKAPLAPASRAHSDSEQPAAVPELDRTCHP